MELWVGWRECFETEKVLTPKFALGAAVRLTRAAAINATAHLRLGRDGSDRIVVLSIRMAILQ